jgi:glutamate dehydrogenase/leucine dehydrogenase
MKLKIKLLYLIAGISTTHISFILQDGILFIIGILAMAGGLIDVEIKDEEEDGPYNEK